MTTSDDRKSIQKLTIHNFMGIEDVEFEPGKVNIIRGPNGAGKTTVLKAISEALSGGGKKPNLIRVGEDKAQVMLDLGEVHVDRRITGAGNYVDVTHDLVGGGAAKVQAPQQYLERLVSPLAFNPIEFFRSKPAERRGLLLSLVPCDVTEELLATDFPGADLQVDTTKHGLVVAVEIETQLVAKRKECNAVRDERAGRAKALAGEVPDGFNADKWRTADVSAINEEIRAAATAEAELTAKRQRIDLMKSEQDVRDAKLDNLSAQIEQLVKQKEDLRTEINGESEKIAKLSAEANAEAMELPDASTAKQMLADYTDGQSALAAFDAAARANEELEQAEAEAKRLDDLVKTARTLPAKLLASATLPIAGLEFTADGFTLNGVELEDLSESEQLRFALDVARAFVGDGLPVILVDGAECLDPKHFAELMEQMQGDDFQYFVTVVGAGAELEIAANG